MDEDNFAGGSILNAGMPFHENPIANPDPPRASALLRAWLLPVCGTLALSSCAKKAGESFDEEQMAAAPISSTFQLAVTPRPGSPENVLAATSPDATPSEPAGSPPAASPGGGAASPAPRSVSPTCVRGWSTPGRGSPLRAAVLDMMRVRPGERFVVEEMRYFVGPEDVDVLGARGDVERWYVKAYTETEPRRRQRWLVRRAAVGIGVDAIAPFDSVGYGAGIWRRPDASDESFADPFQRPCQGTKPGDKCMGLPREVLGCLAGT
jgi:hypothetical protein